MSEFMFEKDAMPRTRIKVVGVGGGGCNSVDSMIGLGLPGVEFYAVNTDLQALSNSKCPNKIQIGKESVRGMGAGGDPKRGESAAMEDQDLLQGILEGGDMAFIAAGLGGGTGTGAAPVIARLAHEMELLTIAIVTKPFSFEGPQKRNRAQQGIEQLRQYVDALIVVENEKLLESVSAKTPLLEAFATVNQILAQGVQSISDLINMPGLINADFQGVRSVMGATGGAVLGVGVGKGENRAVEAVKKACSATLQEKIVIDGAKRVLISLTGGPEMTLREINEAATLVYEAADAEANIILSAVIDDRLTDEIRVTIMATGFGEEPVKSISSTPAHRISTPVRPITQPKPIRGTLTNSAVQAEFSSETDSDEDDEIEEGLRNAIRDSMKEDYGQIQVKTPEPPVFAAPPTIPGALSAWTEDLDDEEYVDVPKVERSVPEPERAQKDNLEIPAIIRRRKSFFS